ncbi:MAG: hypothetical protein ABSA53_16150 [Streptosporangiaceae bacterium]
MTSSPVTRPIPDLPPGSRAALVVAVGTYADPALAGLGAAARDAEQLARVLGDPGIGAFEVTLVIDGAQREIRERVEDFLAARGPGEMAVVYLSCRGVLDGRDRLYFAAADTVRSRLASTGVESGWLLDRLEECRAARQLVILDCCFSGAFARGTAKGGAGTDVRLGQRLAAGGRGRVILTASRSAEGPRESDLGGRGSDSVFTRFLVQGLRTGAADSNGDGLISVDDAYSYAYEQVMASGARQTPQRYISGGDGILWLARSPAAPGGAPAPQPEPPTPLSIAAPRRPLALPGLRRPLGRRKTRAALAVGAAAAVAVLIAALTAPSGAPKKVTVDSDGSYGFDSPAAIAVDGGHVWVANEKGDTVTELNAGDGSLVQTLSGGRYGFDYPAAIAVNGADVWIASLEDSSLTELNAGDGSLVRTVSGARDGLDGPTAIAVDGTHLWVTNEGGGSVAGGSVTELNAADGSLVRVVSSAGHDFNAPAAIAVDGADIWVANVSYSVTELSASDGSLVRTLSGARYGFSFLGAIAADGLHVWVAGGGGGSVTELSASDGSPVRVVSGVGYGLGTPAGIVVDGADVWVAGGNGNSVTELNASDGSRVRTLSGGLYHFDGPAGIVVDGSQLWVTNTRGNSVTQIPVG